MQLSVDIRNDFTPSEDLIREIAADLRTGLFVEGVMEPENVEISLSFVTPEEIRTLNRDYRDKDEETDVLSFPADEEAPDIYLLGDIVISTDRAEEQAREIGHGLDEEIRYLAIHSLFHLLGYDHMDDESKRIMREREKETLALRKRIDTLAERALEAKTHAYISYSHFHVGAALETEDGEIFTGANIENASYGVTRCAEQVAMLKMAYEGARRVRILAVTGDADYTYPCGVCRQMLREFADEDTVIAIVNDRSDFRLHTLDEILPYSFGPEDLDV